MLLSCASDWSPAERKVREQWESAIGRDNPENDLILRGLDDILRIIEKICRLVVEEIEAKRKTLEQLKTEVSL